MGYDVHITRAEFWADNDERQIPLDEWIAVAESDAELTRPHDAGRGFFTAKHLYETGEDAWFDWFDGDVFTKNPDRTVIRKMYGLAQRLDARVQGDDGEHYDEEGTPSRVERCEPDSVSGTAQPDVCSRCGRNLAGLPFFSVTPRAGELRAHCPQCMGKESEPLSRRERVAKLLRVS